MGGLWTVGRIRSRCFDVDLDLEGDDVLLGMRGEYVVVV